MREILYLMNAVPSDAGGDVRSRAGLGDDLHPLHTDIDKTLDGGLVPAARALGSAGDVGPVQPVGPLRL